MDISTLLLINSLPQFYVPRKQEVHEKLIVRSQKFGIRSVKASNEQVRALQKAVLASHIGCQSSVFLCTYLGLPIGASMSRTPQKIIQELESLRRAFFWGGSVEDKKIAWVAWDKILLPFDKGGLGINSLQSCNLSLLSKWWWRFYNEPNTLWVSVIKSIHGDEGGLTNFEAMKVKTGLWFHIARLKEDFLRLNINIDSIFKKSVRNRELTSFWNDRWIGNSTLKIAFGRLYALETDKSCSVSSRCPSFDHTSGLVYRCHWRRPPHGGPESTQLTELEELTTHLRVTDGSDF
ncbi:hypothetical protein Tco_1187307 [Tanacetum coccineum]